MTTGDLLPRSNIQSWNRSVRELIRYVICPGYVRSQTDGDTHFIGARQLIELYNVGPHEFIIYPENDRGWRRPPYSVYLEPQFNGDYSLPTYYGPQPSWKLKSHTPVLAAKLLSASTFLSLFQ